MCDSLGKLLAMGASGNAFFVTSDAKDNVVSTRQNWVADPHSNEVRDGVSRAAFRAGAVTLCVGLNTATTLS